MELDDLWCIGDLRMATDCHDRRKTVELFDSKEHRRCFEKSFVVPVVYKLLRESSELVGYNFSAVTF